MTVNPIGLKNGTISTLTVNPNRRKSLPRNELGRRGRSFVVVSPCQITTYNYSGFF